MKHGTNLNALIINWIFSIKLSRIIALIFLVLISVSVLIHYFLSRVSENSLSICKNLVLSDVSCISLRLKKMSITFIIRDLLWIFPKTLQL